METSSSANHHSSDSTMLSSGPMQNPGFRRGVFWALGVRTMADALPGPLQMVVNNGKMSAAVFLGGYLFMIALWLPFWLVSFLVTEMGVYAMMVGVVFMVGRGIIRMIAFPGSSNRVSSEIEKEFAKYSVKMIVNSANTLIDLAAAINAAGKGDEASATFYEIATLWKRSKSYRDRVLGVYTDVLSYILNDGQQTSSGSAPDLTKFGNNRLTGDIGDLSGLTVQAQTDGRLLLEKLLFVLGEMDRLEAQAKPILESTNGKSQPLSPSLMITANSLGIAASELRDFVGSLKPVPADGSGSDSDDEGDLSTDNVRRRFEEQSGTLMDSVRSGLSSILPMLDPPLHTCIFGFDVQRGCMLSRYRGAQQLWVQRKDGGMIDVIRIPAKSTENSPLQRGTKAVLYCNPNAGLIEVAAGMSLAGGNIDPEGAVNEACWSDFYTNLGFDVYLFNYAGFGRSYGAGFCGIGKRGGEEPYIDGAVGRIRRILHATFCGFQPTPDTLRADGEAVGSHIISNLGVETLVVHGESIGGVAASATARQLSQSSFTRDKMSLLICDRTFCNLEAVAQRLVGGWSGYAIRMLAPFWSTDVANDFIAAACPKVVANDSADVIIFDSASLKAGIAVWKEIYRGAAPTKRVGWMMEAPIQYRMAVDYENVPVNGECNLSFVNNTFVPLGLTSTSASRYVPPSAARLTPPVWPADKHISLEEGFHFAACVKRIGKLASIEKKKYVTTDAEAAMRGVECSSPIFQVWKYLGTCEGLCGAALGMAVRGGYDVTLAWLCCTLTFGGQTVIEGMEHRHNWTEEQASTSLGRLGPVVPADFDCRPPGYESQESETTVHPKPAPEVLDNMQKILQENPNDDILSNVSHELGFVIGTLQYIVARLGSPANIEASWKDRHLQSSGHAVVGSFLNLHCGHNNPFSAGEKKRLRSLVLQATSRGRS